MQTQTPRFVERALEQLGRTTGPYVRQIVDEFIDEFAPAGREDLMLRFARPVPIRVTAGLLGMDERYAAGIGQSLPEVLEHTQYADRADATLTRLCRQLVDEKRTAAGPDLVSWMLHHAAVEEHAEVPQQVHRVLLGVVARSTTRIGRLVSERVPGPGSPPPLAAGQPVDDGQLAPGAHALAELIADTAVERLLSRLPGLRLQMPMVEILPVSILGVDCPESLPATFPPVRVRYTGDEEITWLPAPTFTTAPPLAS
jgi:cytochrome P450